MKKYFFAVFLIFFVSRLSFCEDVDLFILAGQSNAQGFQGDAAHYPQDPGGYDKRVRFYWMTPGHSSSGGGWTTMKAQGGRFKSGHFGLEVTFARALKKAGYHPAVFKYSLGSTSLADNWGGPGDGKMYDQMKVELQKAVSRLQRDGHVVKFRGFIWIQGESDAKTPEMALAYKQRLETLLSDLRTNATKEPQLKVILGVDEQHPFVRSNPQVVQAQQELASKEINTVFTSMVGLEKADTTHLTPKGLEEHGKRIFTTYHEMTKTP